MPPDHSVQLAHEADLAGFRAAARRLCQQAVPPDNVRWQVATAAEGDLFAQPGAGEPPAPDMPDNSAAPLTVPAFFMPLCESVALHADSGRFALLYRLLWRLQREPGLRSDPLDADRLRAEQMARAVTREQHKMTAFVRFRPLAADEPSQEEDGSRWHVAWFEPEHHIVEATAPFFARRFAQMRWAILTPSRCVRWDGHALAFGPGAQREDAPAADAGEQLWLTYYEHIFNPARLKLKMMQKEMPRRYWHNLPEAALIQPLVAQAEARSGRMVDQGGTVPAHRRPAASSALVIAPPTLLHEGIAEGTSIDWDLVRHGPERCRACPIGACATQAVPGEGSHEARLMIVGEQPGEQEDLQGRPFVGPAGQLLDRAFEALHWRRDELYLTNAVKHFKFELRGKRRLHKTAALSEAQACLHWLEAEVALLKPQAAVALGATATRALLGPGVKVIEARGQWFARADGLRVLVTLHPAALLRMPAQQQAAAFEGWLADLLRASDLRPGAASLTPA